MANADLHSAIQRLKEHGIELVEHSNGITADDIDAIIRHCEATENMVSIRYVHDLNDLAKIIPDKPE